MKILMAVDGSPASLRAVEGLLNHVAWFAERPAITLLNVHPPLPSKRAVAWAGKHVVDQYYDEECEEALAAARKLLDDRGYAYTAAKKVGEVAVEIGKFAANEGFGLIAMGTHGRSPLEKLVLGSVATKVIASTQVPVLLFR